MPLPFWAAVIAVKAGAGLAGHLYLRHRARSREEEADTPVVRPTGASTPKTPQTRTKKSTSQQGPVVILFNKEEETAGPGRPRRRR